MQATESLAGPGNEARLTLSHTKLFTILHSCHMVSTGPREHINCIFFNLKKNNKKHPIHETLKWPKGSNTDLQVVQNQVCNFIILMLVFDSIQT